MFLKVWNTCMPNFYIEEWNYMPITCFIPSNNGKERLVFKLFQLLIKIQNDLIDKAIELGESSYNFETRNIWKGISQYEVLNLDLQENVELLIKSSCKKKMDMRKEISSIEYDFDLLQRLITFEWIEGRSKLDMNNIPEIHYTDDLMIKTRLKDIDIRQIPIADSLEPFIVEDCKELNEVYSCLRNLKIAIGYIRNARYDAKKTIYSIFKDLDLDKDFFPKAARENCCLENLLGFWQILSRERSKLLVENNLFIDEESNSLNKEQDQQVKKTFRYYKATHLLNILHEFFNENVEDEIKEES